MIPGQASKHQRRIATQLYEAIVEAARQPQLYADSGIPDTIDGRYDAILLHASLVIHFLADMPESGQSVAQELFDTMFRDFNHNLRQIGIGDLSMARHFRRMSEGFNGRLQAYISALADPQSNALESAIARNVFRTESVSDQIKKLSRYMHDQYEHLAKIDPGRWLNGKIDFATPELG